MVSPFGDLSKTPPPPDGGPPPLSVEAINGNFSLNLQGYNKPLLLRRGGTA